MASVQGAVGTGAPEPSRSVGGWTYAAHVSQGRGPRAKLDVHATNNVWSLAPIATASTSHSFAHVGTLPCTSLLPHCLCRQRSGRAATPPSQRCACRPEQRKPVTGGVSVVCRPLSGSGTRALHRSCGRTSCCQSLWLHHCARLLLRSVYRSSGRHPRQRLCLTACSQGPLRRPWLLQLRPQTWQHSRCRHRLERARSMWSSRWRQLHLPFFLHQMQRMVPLSLQLLQRTWLLRQLWRLLSLRLQETRRTFRVGAVVTHLPRSAGWACWGKQEWTQQLRRGCGRTRGQDSWCWHWAGGCRRHC